MAALQPPPARPRRPRQPVPSASPAVLVLSGSIDPADLPMLSGRLQRVLEKSGTRLVDCDLAGGPEPDLATIEVLARLALAARRDGCRVRLRAASAELLGLVALVGLTDVLASAAASGIEPRGQPEQREEPPGVEEERDPADPAA